MANAHSIMELINPFPRQWDFLEATNDFDFTLYGGSAGSGKLVPLDCPLPCPSGWTTMGALSIGDELFDEKGRICRAVALSAIDPSPTLYRLGFDDGSTIDCCKDHQWVTYNAKELAQLTRFDPEWRKRRREQRRSRSAIGSGHGKEHTPEHRRFLSEAMTRRNRQKTHDYLPNPSGIPRTTQQIVDSLFVGHRANHAILVPAALELPEIPLPLDPYVLGAWLGDGSAKAAEITGLDPEILEEIAAAGFKITHHACGKTHGILGILPYLRKLGVFGNKHVPPAYLRASKAQRLALLQGLMDTDGTVSMPAGSPEFCNTNERIAEAVYELVVSLGWKAYKRKGAAKLYGRYIGPKWTIQFKASDYVFRLPRKRNLQKLAVRRTNKFRYIISAVAIPSVPGRCIQVDSPSSCYLVGKSMIPTHNSRVLRWALVYWLIRWFKDYNLRGIMVGLFCETFRDLDDRQISKAQYEFPDWLGHWSGYDFILNESLGAGVIAFRNLDEVSKFQSVEFAACAIDEITRNPPEIFEFLALSRMRWPGIERTKFMAATNPGGIGHTYVKRLWIDKDFPPRLAHLAPQFKYIQALPTDNPHLHKSYIDKLRALPDNLRRAFLEGDWNSFAGQVFGELRHEVHVVKPFAIPDWWLRWGSNDPGFTDPGVWHWHTVDGDGRVYIYREETFDEETCGERIHYSQQARKVRELSGEEAIQWWVTGMDAFSRNPETGKSIIDYYESGGLSGFRKPIHGPGSVMTRVGVTHEYLRPYKNSEGKLIAKLAIFDTCKRLISTLPTIPHDDQKVEEIDKRCPHLHWWDSASYGICSWHTTNSTEPERSRIVKGSLGDILGHDAILNPPKEAPRAFTYASKPK